LDLNADGWRSVHVQAGIGQVRDKQRRACDAIGMTVYVSRQIHRLTSPDRPMIDWGVNLGAGRTGRVRVPLVVYAAIEATDRDEYIREALADHLTRHQLSDADLLAGDHVAML